MAEDKSIKNAYDTIYNVKYRFNDFYCISYISKSTYENVSEAISLLRKEKEIDYHTYRVLHNIFNLQYKNELHIKYLISIEPRKIAQKFIGKTKIRKWVFNRDKNKCLRCGTSEKLSLDHIIPINNGGENKLSNLQTLCSSCNSWKSSRYIDFR